MPTQTTHGKYRPFSAEGREQRIYARLYHVDALYNNGSRTSKRSPY